MKKRQNYQGQGNQEYWAWGVMGRMVRSEWVRFEQIFKGREEDGQTVVCGGSIPSRGNSYSKDPMAEWPGMFM